MVEDGRLAARTLHAALASCGLEPSRQVFVNLFLDPPTKEPQRPAAPPVVDRAMVDQLAACATLGTCLIGLGRLVQRALGREGLRHLALVHPAARGAIRRREVYRAHVAEQLAGLALARLPVNGYGRSEEVPFPAPLAPCEGHRAERPAAPPQGGSWRRLAGRSR